MNKDIGSSTEENQSTKTLTLKSWSYFPTFRPLNLWAISYYLRKEQDPLICKSRNFEAH